MRVLLLAAAALQAAVSSPGLVAAAPLPRARWSVELAGPPASLVPADVDGDGLVDLAVVTAGIRWGELGVSEVSEVGEEGGLVETLTVIPAIMDRREVAVFLALPEGGYRPAGAPLPLPLSVHSLEAGSSGSVGAAGAGGAPLVALTDDGVSVLRLSGGELELVPLIEDPPVVAGTGAFLPDLRMVHRLTGDEMPELLLPSRRGLAVYRGTPGGFARRSSAPLAVPGESAGRAGALERLYPLPAVEDVSGDGLPDLVFHDPREGFRRVRVMVNARQGRFRAPVELVARRGGAGTPKPVFFGDLDGDGLAELVTRQEIGASGGGIRREMAAAREPKSRMRLYQVDRGLRVASQPSQTLEVTGYGLEPEGGPTGMGIRDLNGDRRLDLVTATLDLTVLKAMRSIATKKLNVGVEFKTWCQGEGGALRPVARPGPEGRFGFDLKDVQIKQVTLFTGDFDGDRRPDFVSAGRGKTVEIRRGRPDCSFGQRPDLTLELAEAPREVTRLQVRDFDGDGRMDVAVAQPRPRSAAEPGLSPSFRLDLYVSRVGTASQGGLTPLDPPHQVGAHPRPLPARPPARVPRSPTLQTAFSTERPLLSSVLTPMARFASAVAVKAKRPPGDPDAPFHGSSRYGGTPSLVDLSSRARWPPPRSLAMLEMTVGGQARERTAFMAGTAGWRRMPVAMSAGVVPWLAAAAPAAPLPAMQVQVLRSGGAEASITRVQGALLAATAWKGAEGRAGLALLTAAHRDGTGARSLLFFAPGRETLERLPDPPAGSDALSTLDLEGDGGAELLVGAPGEVFKLEGGSFRKLLERPGVGLLAPGVRPVDPRWIALAGAGRLELASASGGGLARGTSFELPVAAERREWGLRLVSPPVQWVTDGALFCAGPRAEGRRRLATTLLPLSGGRAEAWSKLPALEEVAETRYARWEGRTALLVGSFGRLGITERKTLRIFLPAPDRTREGHAPVLSRRTGCAIWNRLDASLPDVDGDGKQDLVLIYPEGLRGRELRVEVYPAEGGGRFEPRPRMRSIGVEATAWAWGTDWSSDGAPDLAVLAGGKLQLHAGEGKDRLPAARPAWTFLVAPLFPAFSYELRIGGPGGEGRPEREEAEDTRAERIFELTDVTGDGQPEVVLSGADHQGGVRIVVVRKM